MVRKPGYRLVLMLFIMFLVIIAWDGVEAANTPAYVPAQPGDCINTFTVRLMVAASNIGAAYGEFEGTRLVIVRKGINPQRCWLEMGQWDQTGRMIESKRLQCLFTNPL